VKPINVIILERTERRQWRWRVKDGRGGKILAASSESYRRRKDAHANLQRVTGEVLEIPGSGRGISYSWAVRARA